MIVAMDPIAQPVRAGLPGNCYGSHDLPDLATAAEEVAPGRHPAPDAQRIAVELEGTGIDRRSVGPGHRRLGRDDVEQVDPPGRSLDDVETAVAAGRHVV